MDVALYQLIEDVMAAECQQYDSLEDEGAE